MPSPEASLPSDLQTIDLLMIGDSGVGKTALLVRYIDGLFVSTSVSSIDCKIKNVDIDGAHIKLRIKDPPRQDSSINTSCFQEAEGIVLVYDVTNRNSFESIKRNWINQIQQHSDVHVNKLLVGNKCDVISERVVSSEEGERLAKELKIPFWECSAENSTNVEPAFIGIARAVRDRVISGRQRAPAEAGDKPAARATDGENDQSESNDAKASSEQQSTVQDDSKMSSAVPQYKEHSTSWLISSSRHWERKKKKRVNVSVGVLKRNAKKKAPGWLRRIEREGDVNLKSHLSEDERRLLLHLLVTMLPLETTAFDLVAHAWGVSVSTARNIHQRALDSGNMSTERKKRKDAGTTVFDDDGRRAATYTAAHAFKKQFRQEKSAESKTKVDVSQAFKNASADEIRKAEEQAEAFRKVAANLPQEVEKYLERNNGKMNYNDLARQITGEGNLQVVSADTIRRWVKKNMQGYS